MELISREMCVNCTSCYNACTKDAISIEYGELGFSYPVIDNEKCIDCGLCKIACPFESNLGKKDILTCYVAYNRNEKQRIDASSGGIVALVAEYVLEANGIVIGAAFDKNLNLNHIIATTNEECQQIFGSKYIPSNLGNIFKVIKEEVDRRKVLFIGTPCQVAGLKAFLGVENENLICIDFICHGVPSLELFKKYLSELELKYNDRIVSYDFRDKSTGWDTYSNSAVFENNRMKELATNNYYMKLFLSDVSLRSSCYNCNFKLGNKFSDITLGDFWGVKEHYPEFYNEKGVSAVIINTFKGAKIFENLKANMLYKECFIEEILNANPSLKKSATMPVRRQEFIQDIKKLSIKQLSKKYVKKHSYISTIRNIIFSFIEK